MSNNGIAPWLVLAVGNPSRGDDALGPELVERLAFTEADATDVEFLIDFQLQIEHALDLRGRRAVLFVDAAKPGVIAVNARASDTSMSITTACIAGASITPLTVDERVFPASHALRAEAVLQVAHRLDGAVPPAWQLAIEGHTFTLGEGLSKSAELHLNDALILARQWLGVRRASLG